MRLVALHDELVKRFESLGQGFSADFNLKLERIEHLLRLLGNPERDYRIVHVGGTSGKGTVSTLVSQTLTGHGLKAGLITSPYLQVINETCVIDGRLLDITLMSSLLDEMWPYILRVEEEGEYGRPSYSEVLLAVGLLAFSRLKVDVAVIEAFLGGRLDATNVVHSDVSVLVSVGLDHIEILGNTVEEISRDKVHIMKPGGLAVCGFSQAGPRDIASSHAAQVGAELKLIDRDFSFSYSDEGCLSIQTGRAEYVDMDVSHGARFQGSNAACALVACERMLEHFGKTVDRGVAEQLVRELKLPGRHEVISTKPLVLLDGAHNPPKISAVLELITQISGRAKPVVVYAAKKSNSGNPQMQRELAERQKEIFEILGQASPSALVLTQFQEKGIWRSEALEVLEDSLDASGSQAASLSIPDSRAAFEKAMDVAGSDGAIVVIGSFHLVGEIRSLFVSRSSLLAQNEL